MSQPALTGIPDLEIVVFQWSRRYGPCTDCGLPAAYAVTMPLRYLCAVCAAQAAADGEMITRLSPEES